MVAGFDSLESEYFRPQFRLKIQTQSCVRIGVSLAALYARRFRSSEEIETQGLKRCESGRVGSAGH